MKFTELEELMIEKGVNSLAAIARALDTTPQAVSNWKARDQIPYHIITKLTKITTTGNPQTFARSGTYPLSQSVFEEDTISLSDILLTMAEQLKVILLVPFVTIFITFTYVKFVKQPLYVSWATVLVPEAKGGNLGNLGGFAGLASQFGVNVPTGTQADLSSPLLFPDLLRSRTFAEQILDKSFYTEKFGRELSLLAILTHGDSPPGYGKDTLVTSALGSLGEILEFNQESEGTFSVLKVTASEPVFAKELAEVVLSELEALNRYFKSLSTNEKTSFIINRIASVKDDLETSEQRLKEFNEQNRQISSPALQLELDRRTNEVEIQKGVYLTLKQQLELAKIEAVQETSIVQVLDAPQAPLGPNNMNLINSILLAGVIGVFLGVLLGFVRSYLNNSDMSERRKLRRVRNFIKRKGKDVILDRRISMIVSVMFIIGLPYYFGHQSKNPVFFGMYSPTLMFVNTVYVIVLIASISLFIHLSRKNI